LNAIRRVLDTPSRRFAGVAEFLTAAGLALTEPGARATLRRAAMPPPRRGSSLWRVALPVAAVVALGTAVASYHVSAGRDWRESASELQRRGLDALKTVATHAAPAVPATSPEPESQAVGPTSGAAVATSSAAVGTPAAAPETAVEPPAELPPETQPGSAPPAAPVQVLPVATTAAAPRRGGDPAVLSMGVPRIAAREDHSVVAIDIVRSGDTTRETAVGWWTAPDTAHPDDDYATGGRQTVTFPAGATVERVLIPIVNDGTRESDEVFTVHLGAPRNAVTGDVAATRVTLLDDD
jgi:hypothetical protein